MNDYIKAITQGTWEAVKYVLALLGLTGLVVWITIIVVLMLRIMEVL